MGGLGRNDPCRCGSGKKYKKCCLDSDSQTSPASVDDDPAPPRPVVISVGGSIGVRLRNGDVGYLQTRTDDCLRASVASALQVAPRDVPDPHIDRRLQAGEEPEAISRSMWGELAEWAAERGLQAEISSVLPRSRHRWIGVVPAKGLTFGDHTLLMERDRLLWDPIGFERTPTPADLREIGWAELTNTAPGKRMPPYTYTPAAIRWGIWFEKKENS